MRGKENMFLLPENPWLGVACQEPEMCQIKIKGVARYPVDNLSEKKTPESLIFFKTNIWK